MTVCDMLSVTVAGERECRGVYGSGTAAAGNGPLSPRDTGVKLDRGNTVTSGMGFTINDYLEVPSKEVSDIIKYIK